MDIQEKEALYRDKYMKLAEEQIILMREMISLQEELDNLKSLLGERRSSRLISRGPKNLGLNKHPHEVDEFYQHLRGREAAKSYHPHQKKITLTPNLIGTVKFDATTSIATCDPVQKLMAIEITKVV